MKGLVLNKQLYRIGGEEKREFACVDTGKRVDKGRITTARRLQLKAEVARSPSSS